MIRLIIIMLLIAGGGFLALSQSLEPQTAVIAGNLAVGDAVLGDLTLSVSEQGTLESSENVEIRCRVRGSNTITWVIESGTEVVPGDLLVSLDTLTIEEEISERTKFYHLAKSQAARSAADVARAKLAIDEYSEGRFITQLATLKKNRAVAESRLLNATSHRQHSEMLARSEYVRELTVEERQFAVSQAKLNLSLIQTRIDVLEEFTKEEELIRLNGELKAAEANHAADLERVDADLQRLERAQEELGYCEIRAKRAGLVIYPNNEDWEDAPKIEQGATIRKDQILLLMPDLKQMQIRVGIHESIVDRVAPGLEAEVTMNEETHSGRVDTVAAVARPAGWWTGNVVKYDAVVSLPRGIQGLRPGMSARTDVILAEYQNVVKIPVSAVLQTREGEFCWVRIRNQIQKRNISTGESNRLEIIVTEGITTDEQVVLDPLAGIPEARELALLAAADTAPSTASVP